MKLWTLKPLIGLLGWSDVFAIIYVFIPMDGPGHISAASFEELAFKLKAYLYGPDIRNQLTSP